MPRQLSDQVVVITGASQGIGRETAHRAANAGASVVVTARNEEALRALAAQIERSGGGGDVLGRDGRLLVVGAGPPDAVDGGEPWERLEYGLRRRMPGSLIRAGRIAIGLR